MNRNVIYKTLNLLFQYFVNKEGLPPGTRRQRKDGIYIKQSDGSWLKETEKKEKPEKKEREITINLNDPQYQNLSNYELYKLWLQTLESQGSKDVKINEDGTITYERDGKKYRMNFERKEYKW